MIDVNPKYIKPNAANTLRQNTEARDFAGDPQNRYPKPQGVIGRARGFLESARTKAAPIIQEGGKFLNSAAERYRSSPMYAQYEGAEKPKRGRAREREREDDGFNIGGGFEGGIIAPDFGGLIGGPARTSPRKKRSSKKQIRVNGMTFVLKGTPQKSKRRRASSPKGGAAWYDRL